MMRLASQPIMPPTISQMMIPAMSSSLLFSRPGAERAAATAPQTRDAPRLFRKRKDVSSFWLTAALGGERASVALLALVLVAVLLDARDAKAGHAAAVDRALPAGEFLEAQIVALAGLVDIEQPAGDCGNDLSLAADHPARGVGRRKRVERQRLAERS